MATTSEQWETMLSEFRHLFHQRHKLGDKVKWHAPRTPHKGEITIGPAGNLQFVGIYVARTNNLPNSSIYIQDCYDGHWVEVDPVDCYPVDKPQS